MQGSAPIKERLSLRTIIWIVGLLAAGITLLWTSGVDALVEHPISRMLLQQIGGLCIVAAIANIYWDLQAKRLLLDEAMAVAGLATEVDAAGLSRIFRSFYDPRMPWRRFFEEAREISISVAYANTWRNSNRNDLEEFAKRNPGRLTIILPDPDDEPTMVELGRRFGSTPERVAETIREAASEYEKLSSGTIPGVSVRFAPVSPIYSYYRSDKGVILTPYTYRGRVNVPTAVCHRGFLHDWVTEENSKLLEISREA